MPSLNQGDIRTLTIMHLALLVGQILFAAVIFFVVYTTKPIGALQQYSDQLLLACIVFCAAGYGVANLIFKRKLRQLNAMQGDASQKMNSYRAINILRWGIIQSTIIFTTIVYFMAINKNLLILIIIMIILFAILRPSREKIASDLNDSPGDFE